jgi:hypothetical protein
MRQIALAYVNYRHDWGGDSRDIVVPSSGTAHDWIKILAEQGYLNDPRLVMFDFDYLVKTEVIQANLMGKVLGAMPRRLYDVSRRNLSQDFMGKPLSIVVVSGQIPSERESFIPIGWTRGLNSQGYWNESQGAQGGVFGTSGGIIIFVDGSVRWFDDLCGADSSLCKFGTEQKTSNIFECLGEGAIVLDWQGPLNAAVSGSGHGADGENMQNVEEGGGDSENDSEASLPPGNGDGTEDTGNTSTSSPIYDSLKVRIDLASSDAAALRRLAMAYGAEGAWVNILDAYEELQKGSGASNENVDACISGAFNALADVLSGIGINFDTSAETQAIYWSAFLGSDGIYYTDNQNAWDYDPQDAARDVLHILQAVDVEIGDIYRNLPVEEQSQFALAVQAFSSEDAGGTVDLSSNASQLVRAYLQNQAWIMALQYNYQAM